MIFQSSESVDDDVKCHVNKSPHVTSDPSSGRSYQTRGDYKSPQQTNLVGVDKNVSNIRRGDKISIVLVQLGPESTFELCVDWNNMWILPFVSFFA
jgi:hypothetical protein